MELDLPCSSAKTKGSDQVPTHPSLRFCSVGPVQTSVAFSLPSVNFYLRQLFHTLDMDAARPEKRRRLDRISAACDLCKARKVKCDGSLPCSYCKRKNHSDSCTFSGPKSRQTKSSTNTPARRGRDASRETTPLTPHEVQHADTAPAEHSEPYVVNSGHSPSPTLSRTDHHDTAVPLEARLLRDAQGKVVFIGDSAPISFLQTVRHLVASEADALPVQMSRDSFVEAAQPEAISELEQDIPRVHPHEVESLLKEYHVATSGLVDLFAREQLLEDIRRWAAEAATRSHDISSAVKYLVLAVGMQESDERKAEAWFTHAKQVLMVNLVASMHIATVQGFALVAVYMLRAFQPNGAFLYFCKPSFAFESPNIEWSKNLV